MKLMINENRIGIKKEEIECRSFRVVLKNTSFRVIQKGNKIEIEAEKEVKIGFGGGCNCFYFEQ